MCPWVEFCLAAAGRQAAFNQVITKWNSWQWLPERNGRVYEDRGLFNKLCIYTEIECVLFVGCVCVCVCVLYTCTLNEQGDWNFCHEFIGEKNGLLLGKWFNMFSNQNDGFYAYNKKSLWKSKRR